MLRFEQRLLHEYDVFDGESLIGHLTQVGIEWLYYAREKYRSHNASELQQIAAELDRLNGEKSQ